MLNVAAALSLLLCVAAALLWWRSYVRQDLLMIRPGASLTTYHLFQARGNLAVTVTHQNDYELAPHRARHGSTRQPIDLYAYWRSQRGHRSFAGFAISGWGVMVPHWSLVLVTAALPARAVMRARRRRRAAREGANPCPSCGYDLRATPDRCPECGTAVGNASDAADAAAALTSQ